MAMTCVLMCLHNPFILIWDAGFQLSFISTLGLVYITPLIREWFEKIPEFPSSQAGHVNYNHRNGNRNQDPEHSGPTKIQPIIAPRNNQPPQMRQFPIAFLLKRNMI